MEYGQRLRLERRNVCAEPGRQPDTAGRLFESALRGGGRACGEARWGLVAGARADLLVVDLMDASLVGLPRGHWLDALVFSSPGRPWRDVMVAGHWAVRNHVHPGAASIGGRVADGMRARWGE